MGTDEKYNLKIQLTQSIFNNHFTCSCNWRSASLAKWSSCLNAFNDFAYAIPGALVLKILLYNTYSQNGGI